MTINRYFIEVTLSIIVEIEAETEAEADDKVFDAVHEEGYGDLSIIGSRLVETIIDGPAKHKAWSDAWENYHRVLGKYGSGSAEVKAARAAIPEESGI